MLEAMRPYFTEYFFNPSSPYAPAIAVRRDYEAAKSAIAQVIGVKADELVMTAGATESINLMFNAVAGHVVTTSIEHQAVLNAAKHKVYTLVAPDKQATVSPLAVQAAIRSDTQLVSVAYANNEVGTIQSLKDIAMVVEAERQRRLVAQQDVPLYLHTDASQGAGLLDLHVSRLGIDAMTLNAGKVYGPKQVGLLWAAPRVRLAPFIHGGGQEGGLRSGTENVAGVIGFAKALTAAEAGRRAESARLSKLRDDLQQRLTSQFPHAIVSGNQKKRLPNFLHISFPGLDAERLLFALESQGVFVATGSACAANKGLRSHVLSAIGLSDSEADGSLRISLGRYSSNEHIEQAGYSIIQVVQNEMNRVGNDGY